MMSNKKSHFLVVIGVLCLLVIATVSSVMINAYDREHYIANYAHNEIGKATGLSDDKLAEITDDLISYLKHGEEELLAKHYNERECMHMRDVYNLFAYARIAMILSVLILSAIFAYYYICKNHIDFIIKFTKAMCWMYAIIAVFGGLVAMIGFGDAFIAFHRLFFSNELWILNPKTDLMIVMLPEDFFANMAFSIALSTFVSLFIIQLGLFVYVSIRRHKK